MTAVATAQPPAPRRRSLWRRSSNTRTAYLFLLPALIVMALITFYPAGLPGLDVVHLLRARKPPRRTRPAPPFVGLENFRRILDNNIVIPNFDFLRILVFNLFWALSNVVIHVVLGVAIALILNVEGLEVQADLARGLHPAGRDPADHRRHGLAEHVRSAVRARSTRSSTARSASCSSCRR